MSDLVERAVDAMVSTLLLAGKDFQPGQVTALAEAALKPAADSLKAALEDALAVALLEPNSPASVERRRECLERIQAALVTCAHPTTERE